MPAKMGHAGPMAITLPFGIRIAAGLLASTIEKIGKLPQELPTLGISLAGQVVRTSFRIRQEIAELATRGDELLSGITGRPQEKPDWATFDEDEGPPAEPPTSGAAGSVSSAAKTSSAKTSGAGTKRPTPKPKGPVGATSSGATTRPVPVPGAGAVPGTGTDTAVGFPLPLAGDHLLSIAELREELLDLGIAAVRRLLVLEESGPHRAAYLTLLSNRLTTLEHENGQSQSR